MQVLVQLRARHAVGCFCRHLGATTLGMQGLHVGAHQSQGGGRRRGQRLHLGARLKPNGTVKLGPGPKTVWRPRLPQGAPAASPMSCATRTEQRQRVGEAEGSTLTAAAAQ